MNNMEFVIKRIGDICSSSCSGGTPKSSEPSYYEGGTIPWLTTGEVNFKDIYETENKITELGLQKSAAKYIPINSVIVAMYGVTAGKSAINKIELTTNQACCNLQIDEKQANYRFVYYYLMLQSDQLNKLANGGAQQNLNSIIIKKFKIPLPDLSVQNKIANVLSNYDRIIENNNKRIRLLESIAESIYKEWFIRYRFPGCENYVFTDGYPVKWKKCKLREVAHESGKPLKKEFAKAFKYYLPIDCIPNRAMMLQGYDNIENAESSLESFSTGNILFGAMRTYFHKVVIAPFDGVTRSTCFIIDANNKKYQNYLYLFLYQDSTIDYSSTVSVGSTMPYVRWKDLNRIGLVMPDEVTIEKFNKIVDPILKQIRQMFFVNENLKKQRDALLPRLMSGDLSVEGKEIV